MASNAELNFEWSLLFDDDSDKITEKHLQLAAELGKTLLERNKELEATIKQHQLTIDDQAQEIEYLTKQNNALREVNDTRLKIYENIEISIQDLEKQNHRLNVDNSNFKKANKTLTATNESLEERLEDLRKQIEELNREVEIERRKNERLQIEQRNRKDETLSVNTNICSNDPDPNKNMKILSASTPISVQNEIQQFGFDEVDRLAATCDNEEIVTIISELDGTKRQLAAERQRVSELEDQLSSLIQDNRELQNRITQNAESYAENEMRSMHEELAILEESGQGKMCRRCLRGFDDDALTVPDYASSIAGTEDGDDASLSELMPRTNSVQNIYNTSGGSSTNQGVSSADSTIDLSSSSPNLYRDLVEKYEALLNARKLTYNRNRSGDTTPVGSLQDELASSGCAPLPENNTETNASDAGKTESDSDATVSVKSGARRKLCIRTPTDFSEAETSSSGFSDEISTKFTQTEETFLCTIADGDDKFSIYDEAQPIDSRFRHCPKYRHLFKEIFATLKKAAENKDEGEKLPLLDDTNPAFKVPPVTPAAEELPSFPEVETESVVSSVVSEQSVAMSECVTKHERKTAKKNLGKTGQENKPPSKREAFENVRMVTPSKRDPLEFYALNNLRKKNKKRNRQPIDSADAPAVIPSSPRFFYANRKRRDRAVYEFNRPSGSQTNEASGSGNNAKTDVIWNGNSITVYNRNIHSKGGRNNENATGETVVYRTKSAAGHDLHKLMKLDLSYAEVLRRADQSNKHHRRK